MTEDSQNRVRGYGPFQEHPAPTEQTAAHDAAASADPAASPTLPELSAASTHPPPGPEQHPSAPTLPTSTAPHGAAPTAAQPPAGTYPSAEAQAGGAYPPGDAYPLGDPYSSSGTYLPGGAYASDDTNAPSDSYRPGDAPLGDAALDDARRGAADPVDDFYLSGNDGSQPPSSGSTRPETPSAGTAQPEPLIPGGADSEPSGSVPTGGGSYSYGPFQGGAPAPHQEGAPYLPDGSPASGSAYPTNGVPASGVPTSGAPMSGAPMSGAPASGIPISGGPMSGGPTSGIPASGGSYGYGPFRGAANNDNWDASSAEPVDPFGLPPSSFSGRRIEPSPPPDRSRLIVGVAAGLVAGLLLFGTGGWFAGRATAPEVAAPATVAASGPAPAGSLGVFEQSQVAINQPDFDGTGLTTISQGWMPYLSSCSRSGRPGGPALNDGEAHRVRCTMAGMSAIFVEYKSLADRDKARVRTLGQNVDARTLTPGAGPSVERPTPSNRTRGNYVEYAYSLTESGTTRTVAGIWWDDAQTPIAAYLLAYWKDGIGERWEPMRDLWSRYA
ncbi:hypothetical protein GCM10010172_36450 [Paractinoplanes ferrugineus]|uniref:Uncharacterized protein n=1 Tax=Paractinoplanes ferrugineus TaxID=113564 RepID=A0A919MIL3_9ACTN|nr:hypothetical protein [Actinoplanes ferrugineus]GIE09242.1 hypothetical protein Afe05nite_10820 [Actinoplanes ferrugineus]